MVLLGIMSLFMRSFVLGRNEEETAKKEKAANSQNANNSVAVRLIIHR